MASMTIFVILMMQEWEKPRLKPTQVAFRKRRQQLEACENMTLVCARQHIGRPTLHGGEVAIVVHHRQGAKGPARFLSKLGSDRYGFSCAKRGGSALSPGKRPPTIGAFNATL